MTVRKVSKWEFDGQTYDSKEEAQGAEREAVVKHLLGELGLDYRVYEPVARRWQEVLEALLQVRKHKLTPPRADG